VSRPFETPEQVLEAFGRRVRQLRSWRDLSQDALATRSGISRDHLARIEQGRASAGVVVLHKIAAGLGIGVEELFADGLPSSWESPRMQPRREQPS
jgi:transcriptional regulator with XRE-family HTH domain